MLDLDVRDFDIREVKNPAIRGNIISVAVLKEYLALQKYPVKLSGNPSFLYNIGQKRKWFSNISQIGTRFALPWYIEFKGTHTR